MHFGTDRTSEFLQVISSSKLANTANDHKKHTDYNDTISNPLKVRLNQSALSNFTDNHRSTHTNGPVKHPSRTESIIKSRSKFSSVAANISNDIACTCDRLESLNTLARQRNLFDDHSFEVQQLTLLIKEDIAKLNQRIADLQHLSKGQFSQGNQSAKHSSSVLVSLQTRLASMSNKFKQVLEHRSSTLQDQVSRKNEYSVSKPANNYEFDNVAYQPDRSECRPLQTDDKTSVPVSMPSILLLDEQRARLVAGGLPPDDASRQAMKEFEDDTLVQRFTYHDQTESYLTSRYDTVRTIEHTIVELGEIFQQLATMVQEQDESVQRIDANVDEAANSVEAGYTELLRYFRSVSSNRWLMFKVFGILLAFFVFFVIVFV